MKAHSILYAGLLMAFLHTAVSAQWSNNPAVNNPINTMAGEQAIPKIATCPNGDSYIASFSNEGGNYNVRLQRLDAQGNELWATNGILISNHPQMTWLTEWDMTADNANHAILTFQDIRNGGNNNVVAYRISPTGAFVWGADGIALSNSTAFNAAPKVCVTAAGNAVFAWSADDVVIMQKVSPSGSLLWGSAGITLSGPNTYSWPQLLPVGADEVILKYFEDTGSFPALTRHIFAQRYDASGSPVWSSPVTVSNGGGITAWTQALPFINDGSDGFYIAWHDQRYGASMPPKVYVHHINSSGQAVFTANGVEVSSSSYMLTEAALALPPGSPDIYVFYNEIEPMFQSDWGISGQKISSTGTKLWGANGMAVIPVTGTQRYLVDARKSPADVVVFYEEYLDGSNTVLKATRLNASGGFVWSPTIKDVTSVVSQKVHPVVNEFANNQWILSWEDNRSTNSDIYAQNIQLNGDLGPYDPQEGTIEGTVTLTGGSASVTWVDVTAGTVITNPASNGSYSMVVPVGTYDVIASLNAFYIPDTVFGVVVLDGQATTGVNLTLQALPTGFISGHVQLSGGNGSVTAVEIMAGTQTTNPAGNGDYSMEVLTGTYDVTASLAGYEPDTNYSVTVVEGQTTGDVDFILEYIPVTGFITGNVELENNAGDVTEVTVIAGAYSTYPDINGDYILETPGGTYDVSASLYGFQMQVQPGIVVQNGMTTVGVDFFLYMLTDPGYIEGMVTLVNGTANVTEVVIEAGGVQTNPNPTGHYYMPLDPGTYTVHASHPYAIPDSVTGVMVTSGATTSDVDLELEIVRGNMVCRAIDNYGDTLNNINVELTGPEGTYDGMITNDSLVFDNLPYGDYSGMAWMTGEDPVYQNSPLNAANHNMIFNFIIGGTGEGDAGHEILLASPNPFSSVTYIDYLVEGACRIGIDIYSTQGQKMQTLVDQWQTPGRYRIEWQGISPAGTVLPPGCYFLVYRSSGSVYSRVLIKR